MEFIYKLVVAAIYAITVIFMLCVLSIFSEGAVSKKHDNSLGVVQYQTNPFTYLEGNITNVSLVGTGVNLRMQPRATYGLFTQEVLLCDYDHVATLFAGKSGVVVMTYEIQAHRTIEGIGCHDLITVDEVSSSRP